MNITLLITWCCLVPNFILTIDLTFLEEKNKQKIIFSCFGTMHKKTTTKNNPTTKTDFSYLQTPDCCYLQHLHQC
jgi:hypothetical protein